MAAGPNLAATHLGLWEAGKMKEAEQRRGSGAVVANTSKAISEPKLKRGIGEKKQKNEEKELDSEKLEQEEEGMEGEWMLVGGKQKVAQEVEAEGRIPQQEKSSGRWRQEEGAGLRKELGHGGPQKMMVTGIPSGTMSFGRRLTPAEGQNSG